MDPSPEIKFNYDISELCANNKMLIDKTGELLYPLFNLINDIHNRKLYNIQQIFSQGTQHEILINSTKMQIDYQIYNNINPYNTMLEYNKYVRNYGIYKASANYHIAQINFNSSIELLNTNQHILNQIDSLYKLIDSINKNIDSSFDVSLSFAKRIEWKAYVKPFKDQYNFVKNQKEFGLKQIEVIQNDIQKYYQDIIKCNNDYTKMVYPPTFISLTVIPPPLPTEPMPLTEV